MEHADTHRVETLRCPSCGGPLRYGYIMGKQSRLRWADTPEGFTVFKGTPLTSLPRGFWTSKAAWARAPHVEAGRCEQCGVGVFSYDLNPTPLRSPRRALVLLMLFAGCLTVSMVALMLSLFSMGPGDNSVLGGGVMMFSGLMMVLAGVSFIRFFVETV